MLKTKILLIFMLSFLIVFHSEAQTKRVLTLDDCIKIGFENSKTIKVSKSKLVSAQEKTSEVSAAMYPSLKFSGTYSRLSSIPAYTMSFMGYSFNLFPTLLNSTQLRFTLAQPLFTGFRLSSATEISELNEKASEEDLKKDKSQLVLDIKNSFWSYYNALEGLKSINESIDQMKSHVTDIDNMFKSGLATNNDVLKTKVQLSNLELTKIDLENAVQMSMLALNNVTGLPVTDVTEIKADVSSGSAPLPEIQTLLNNAWNERNELKSLEFRAKAAEAGVTLAKSGWYPQLMFSANYLYADPNQRIFPSTDAFKGTWDLNLSLSFDIWNWMTISHQTAQAKESLEQSRIGLSQLKDAIALEVSQNQMTVRKLQEKIRYSEEVISQAQENYRVTNDKFKAGLAINSELLDAETSLLLSKINHNTAVVEFEIAKAKLERSIGKAINN